MVLWRITHYHDALNVEARIRRARALLRIRFGRGWKRTAPPDLVWMLGIAPFAADACARVDTLIKHSNPTSVIALSTEDDCARTDAATGEGDEGDQLDEAVKLNEQHWAARNRPVSAETLRKHLHIGAARARELTTAVRAMDKAAVNHKTTLLPTESG